MVYDVVELSFLVGFLMLGPGVRCVGTAGAAVCVLCTDLGDGKPLEELKRTKKIYHAAEECEIFKPLRSRSAGVWDQV